MTCAGWCGRQLLTKHQWALVRGTPDADGLARHSRRGLCYACARTATARGVIEDYPTRVVLGSEVADEWRRMADPERSINWNVRNLAPRMGMTVGALGKAVQRMRAAERRVAA